MHSKLLMINQQNAIRATIHRKHHIENSQHATCFPLDLWKWMKIKLRLWHQTTANGIVLAIWTVSHTVITNVAKRGEAKEIKSTNKITRQEATSRIAAGTLDETRHKTLERFVSIRNSILHLTTTIIQMPATISTNLQYKSMKMNGF